MAARKNLLFRHSRNTTKEITMKKTHSIGLAALALALVLGLGLQDSFARPGGFREIPLDMTQVKELRQLHRDLEDKQFEMMELFSGKTVDADKARALQKQAQDVRNNMAAFWLEAALKYKQAHPDWTPAWGRGMGMGMGGGHGYGHGPYDGGRGYGPGMMDDSPEDN